MTRSESFTHNGPFGGQQAALERVHVGCTRACDGRREGFGIRHVSQLRQHVFRKGDDHRAGAALCRHMEGARQDLRNAFGTVDLDDPFRHAAEDGLVVEFLKGLALLHVACHLPHEHDQRR